MVDGSSDYYSFLQVPVTCNRSAIRKAFLKRSKEVHPDKRPREERTRAHEDFVRLKEAYDCLLDEEARKSYDASRRVEQQRGSSENSPQQPENQQRHSHPQNQNHPSGYQQNQSKQGNGDFSREPGFGASSGHFHESRSSGGAGHRNNNHSSRGTTPDGSNPFQSNHSSSNSGFNQQSYNAYFEQARRRRQRQQQEEWCRRQREREEERRRQHEEENGRRGRQQQEQARQRQQQDVERQRQQAYLGRQQQQQQHSSPPRPPSHTFGKTKSGDYCKNCIKQGCYCWQHQYQDPNNPEYAAYRRFGRSPSSATTKPSSPRTRHRTTTQSAAAAPTLTPLPRPPATRVPFGRRKDGQSCKRCENLGRFCHQHVHQ